MNTVKITDKQQEVCGVITEMNQVIHFFLNSESFKYKASIHGNTYNFGAGEADYDEDKVRKNETEVVIPLKHLSNFWSNLRKFKYSTN